MIVSCEHCSTRFHLDDAKIPESGARVRCSRCKHAFFIQAPGAEDEVQAEDLAREALRRGPEPGPGRESEVGEGNESDWQFNEDSDESAERAVDELLGAGPEDEASEDADADTIENMTVEAESPPEEAGSADPETDEAASLEVDPGGDLEEEPGASGLELATRDSETPEGVEPDLGDPDEWDFFDQDEDAQGRPVQAGQGRAVLGRVELVQAAAAGSFREIGPADRAPLRTPPSEEIPLELAEELARRRLRRARIGNAVGWTATAALVLLGLHRGLVPRAPRAASAPTPVLAGLEARDVEGHWLENAAAGPLYVVSGSLRNPQPTAAAPRALLFAELLDSDGARVAAEPAVLGPPRAAEELRERDPRDVREEQELSARRAAWDALAPGEERPFHAIFPSVPREAARFRLEPGPAVPRPAPPLEEPTTPATSGTTGESQTPRSAIPLP